MQLEKRARVGWAALAIPAYIGSYWYTQNPLGAAVLTGVITSGFKWPAYGIPLAIQGLASAAPEEYKLPYILGTPNLLNAVSITDPKIFYRVIEQTRQPFESLDKAYARAIINSAYSSQTPATLFAFMYPLDKRNITSYVTQPSSLSARLRGGGTLGILGWSQALGSLLSLISPSTAGKLQQKFIDWQTSGTPHGFLGGVLGQMLLNPRGDPFLKTRRALVKNILNRYGFDVSKSELAPYAAIGAANIIGDIAMPLSLLVGAAGNVASALANYAMEHIPGIPGWTASKLVSDEAARLLGKHLLWVRKMAPYISRDRLAREANQSIEHVVQHYPYFKARLNKGDYPVLERVMGDLRILARAPNVNELLKTWKQKQPLTKRILTKAKYKAQDKAIDIIHNVFGGGEKDVSSKLTA